MKPRGRRSYVMLGVSSRGVIWRADGRLQRLLSGYELTCMRNMASKSAPDDYASREEVIGHDVRTLTRGDVCYAFYAKATDRVKIGRTADLPERWRRLETASGTLMQLLSVWHCDNSRKLESELFAHYAEHRTIGEWFHSELIIKDLKRAASQRRWLPTTVRPEA